MQSDVSIRGASFGQTLVLLNGIRISDAQSGHHNMDLPIPPEGISRVEVLHGSGSTMYGSDAVGGVINVITDPPESSEFRLRTSAGNFGVNQERGSLSLVHAEPGRADRFFARFFERLPARPGLPQPGDRFGDALGSLRWARAM